MTLCLRLKSYLFFTATFLILSAQPSFSQTFTPRYNTSMAPQTNGFYEYLPEGYGSGNQKYPLLIFFHGQGELGDGSTDQLPKVLRNGPPKQINQGIFPKSFTVNGNTYRYIVLCPQASDNLKPANINTIINYAISHYRVDTSRIYLTGLSMGGGDLWYYIGETVAYASRIAAVVPVCGAGYPANDRCINIAAANVAVWATHNENDPTVPLSYTTGFVNGINRQNPPPDPLAKMTIFPVGGHDAWTKTYDLNFKENGMNVYEWMLQYSRKTVLPVSNLLFSASPDRNSVVLKWTTDAEKNNAGFNIERSIDGSHFDSLSFVPSSGVSSNSYQFTDFSPNQGENYYRLKILSTTGHYTYSDIREITLRGEKTISIYPNPVNGILHIRSGYAVTNAQLKITDMSGKSLMQSTINGMGDHSIPVRLPAGMYVATLIENGKIIFNQSFIKK